MTDEKKKSSILKPPTEQRLGNGKLLEMAKWQYEQMQAIQIHMTEEIGDLYVHIRQEKFLTTGEIKTAIQSCQDSHKRRSKYFFRFTCGCVFAFLVGYGAIHYTKVFAILKTLFALI